MTSPALLPSWRPGPTRDAVVAFLAAAEALPVEARVAAGRVVDRTPNRDVAPGGRPSAP